MIKLVVFLAVVALVGAVRKGREDGYRTVREHGIKIHGIPHTAHVDWSARSFAYDSTGHGHFVSVRMVNDVLVMNNVLENDEDIPAGNDERREYQRFFGPGTCMYPA